MPSVLISAKFGIWMILKKLRIKVELNVIPLWLYLEIVYYNPLRYLAILSGIAIFKLNILSKLEDDVKVYSNGIAIMVVLSE